MGLRPARCRSSRSARRRSGRSPTARWWSGWSSALLGGGSGVEAVQGGWTVAGAGDERASGDDGVARQHLAAEVGRVERLAQNRLVDLAQLGQSELGVEE